MFIAKHITHVMHVYTGLAEPPQSPEAAAIDDPARAQVTYTYRVAVNWPGITTASAELAIIPVSSVYAGLGVGYFKIG